jgi:hypothetical protein
MFKNFKLAPALHQQSSISPYYTATTQQTLKVPPERVEDSTDEIEAVLRRGSQREEVGTIMA